MQFSRWVPILAMVLGLAGADVSWSAAIVSVPVVSPQSARFDVPVDISGVSDLYAFQFDLSYDPQLIHATSISEGAFLRGGGATTLFLPGSIDNTVGTVSMTADSLAGAVPGVSGAGDMAVVHFFVAASGVAGASPLTLSMVTLLDSNLNDIPFSVSNGQVVVPEPRFGGLVAGALVLMVAFRRRFAWARSADGTESDLGSGGN